MTQAKLIIQAGMLFWPAKVAAREHNIECHDGKVIAGVEIDPDYKPLQGTLLLPKYRIYCEQCAELADDEETKGDTDGE